MDINQMVEKLKSEMPKDLNEIEVAKYIYVELGKTKSYDEKYFFGNSKTKSKIYRLARNTPNRINETMKKKRIVCVSLSYLYRELLKRFDIKSYIHYPDFEGEHAYVVISLKDGRNIKGDLQLDLPMIQTKMKTRYFGTKEKSEIIESFDAISDEENIEIDKRINYINDEKDYRDEEIKTLRKNCQGKSPIEISKIIISNQAVNNLPLDMGYVDRSKYYIGLFRLCMSRKNFDIVHCYRYDKNEDEEQDKKYKMILSVYDKKNSQATYTFSERQNRFIPIEPNILKEIAFNENSKSDPLNTTYWCRNANYSGARKMMHYIKENEKKNQNDNQDYPR